MPAQPQQRFKLSQAGLQNLGTRRQEHFARVIVWVYSLAAISSVLMLLFRRPGRSSQSLPEFLFTMLNIPLAPSLVSVAVLTLISGALIRRKRIALYIAGFFQVIGVIISAWLLIAVWSNFAVFAADAGAKYVWFVLAENLAAVVIGIALIALFIWVRPSFPARLTPGSWLVASAVFISGMIVSVACTYLLILLTRSGTTFDWAILRHSLLRAIGMGSANMPKFGHIPGWIPTITGILIGITIFVAAYLFMSSSRRSYQWSGANEVHLRTILAETSAPDSLSYFATRRDKSLIFSPDGRAAIAYRVVSSVALASGDPIGPVSAWPEVMAAFLENSRKYGWVPAVISSGEKAARLWSEAGLAVVTMGDEAILETGRFDLANTSMTPVRRAVKHAQKQGLTVQIRRHQELSAEEMKELVILADKWRDGESERGFSMALGRLADPADSRCVLVSAHDETGAMQGFLSFVPWGQNGASLDLMRRSPESPNGVTELMVSTLLSEGADYGIKRISLNFAMFRSIFESSQRVGASPLTRLNSRILGRLDHFFQLERLYRSNDKYGPEWVPRYLCFDGSLTLLRVLLAAGIAEGFVPWPFQPRAASAQLNAEQLAVVEQLNERKINVADLEPRRSDQSRHRVRHASQLRAVGRDPYPLGLPRPDEFAEVYRAVSGHDIPGVHTRKERRIKNRNFRNLRHHPRRQQRDLLVSARVLHLRHHGGVSFVDLTYGGQTIQAVLEAHRVGQKNLRELQRYVDTGDLVQMRGRPGRSRSGERSLLVNDWQMAAKALQPIPFAAFDDPEARLRRRSTDLIVHPQQAGLLIARARIVRSIRTFFTRAGYTEMETPMLNVVHGGASARPFRTHINAYGMDLTMRIAPELYLKRLLVGELGAIYEIGRNFRNEGADATHNPEFTSLEAYAPYADYNDMRKLTEKLIKFAAKQLYGKEVLPLKNVHDEGGTVRLTDVSGPWRVVTVCDAVSEYLGRKIDLNTDFEELLAIAKEHEIHVRDEMGPGALIEELYGELVEPATVMPTFYTDFPLETSPLTAPHRSQPGLVERWDLVAGGMEIGTAYSELADPLEQRKRFMEQSLKAAAGDAEAMEVDEDFLQALENGMPPAGGLGIGVDRLVMLLTDTNIREVLTFPFVKPANK